ncbi:putative transposase, partial [Propionivibrio sp.]|uniref:putative transposase n=1 Tax=Propionivibrio sp. TaxID=2212460 RepID=UPI003BEF7840
LSRSLALFGALNIEQTIEPARMEAFTQKKAALKDEIDALQVKLVALKATRKATDRHIAVKDLPQELQFTQLSTHSKHFVDAIKMVAYRAETAMANFLRESLTRVDEARTLLCSIYTTEADLLPDYQNKTLTVRLHHLAQLRSDQAAALLCDELNPTETVFPRTDLRMIFELGKTKTSIKETVRADFVDITKS